MSARENHGGEPNERVALLEGTLDLLISRTLAFGLQHGQRGLSNKIPKMRCWCNTARFIRRSRGWRSGWIVASWGTSDNSALLSAGC